MDADEEKCGRLPIRVRRMLGADGKETCASTVYCPWRERSLSVEECTACEDCEGMVVDPSERSSFLLCAKAGIEEGVQPGEDSRSPRNGFVPRVGQTRVYEIMNGNVVCVRPDMRLETVLALFLERGLSAVPVVDDQGRSIGMVTKTDLLRQVHEVGGEAEEGRRGPLTVATRDGARYELGPGFHIDGLEGVVKDIMTIFVYTVHENASLSRAAALMAGSGIHRIPVVSDSKRVVGVLSLLDIARWVAQQDGYLLSRAEHHRVSSPSTR